MDDLLDGGPQNKLARIAPKELVEKRMDLMLALIPTDKEKERFRAAARAIVSDPNIAGCDGLLVYRAISACATVNVVPNTPLKQAYIIPYKGTPTLIFGYPGIIELARRADPTLQIRTGVVYDNDQFEFEDGIEPHFRVKRYHWQDGQEPGKVEFAWCVSRVAGQATPTLVVTPGPTLLALQAQKGKQGRSPWMTDFGAMCEKTAIRRASKTWTLSAEKGDDAKRFRQACAFDEVDATELPDGPEEVNDDLASLAEGVGTLTGDVVATPPANSAKPVKATVRRAD